MAHGILQAVSPPLFTFSVCPFYYGIVSRHFELPASNCASRSFQVLLCSIPVPDFVPSIQYSFSAHLAFEFNLSALHAALYLAYHFILQPTATALLYTPQMVLSLLSATAYSRSGNVTRPAILHAVSWILHFIGHAVAEKRTPAPLDTFVMGAVALAPFMTSPDFLYKLGYRPRMYKELDKKR